MMPHVLTIGPTLRVRSRFFALLLAICSRVERLLKAPSIAAYVPLAKAEQDAVDGLEKVF